MKRIIIIACILCLVGCGFNKQSVDDEKQKLFKEVNQIEKNMKKIAYFKVDKSVDEEYLVCNGTQAQLEIPSKEMKRYQIHQEDKKLAFISRQNIEDERQEKVQYYHNGFLYTSYSQLPYDISKEKKDDSYTYYDIALKAIDNELFNLKRKKLEGGILYTYTLKQAKEFNKRYPKDLDDQTCSLKGDYIRQEITLKVDKKGRLLEEKVKETIRYQSEDKVSERENSRIYIFYDYDIENDLDFDLISAYQ